MDSYIIEELKILYRIFLKYIVCYSIEVGRLSLVRSFFELLVVYF